jgi:hypothetical protein
VILRKTIDDADRLADDLYDPKIYENNVVTMCHYISGRALASGTFKAHDMATPAPCGQICFVAVGRKSDGASGAVVVASHVFYSRCRACKVIAHHAPFSFLASFVCVVLLQPTSHFSQIRPSLQ